MKKVLALSLAIFLALGLLALAGCGKKETEVDNDKYAGKYISRENSSNYMELRDNNTFDLMKDGSLTSGSWDIEGTNLQLSAGSFNETMKISGGNIAGEDGTKYEKGSGTSDTTDKKSEQEELCKKAMIDFYLKDKPENWASEIRVSDFQMNDAMTEANGAIEGTTGEGAVNHGYAKVGDLLQGEPVKAVYQDGAWVCSWAIP